MELVLTHITCTPHVRDSFGHICLYANVATCYYVIRSLLSRLKTKISLKYAKEETSSKQDMVATEN